MVPIREPKAMAMSLYKLANAIDEADPTAAAAMYEKAIAYDPKLAIAYVNLGNCYFRLNDTEKARHCYYRALYRDPGLPEAHYNIGFLLVDSGRPADSVDYFVTSIRLDPDFADAHFNLATAYEKLGEQHKAKSHWQAYVNLESGNKDSQSWVSIARSALAR